MQQKLGPQREKTCWEGLGEGTEGTQAYSPGVLKASAENITAIEGGQNRVKGQQQQPRVTGLGRKRL